MIGYYFIQNKYIFVGNKDKEMTAQSVQSVQTVSNIRIEESFDTEEDENENLIHNNKNKGTNISKTYKKLFNYIF
jgi:hypothetical protein